MKKKIKRLALSAAALAVVAELPGAAFAAPDPKISLDLVKSVSGFQTALEPGDHLRWYVGVRNDGNVTAENVVARAAIPAGLSFVVGSISNLDIASTVVQFSSDHGATWNYVPSSPTGTPDPNITDVRFVRAGLAVGTDGRFIADTEASLADGVYEGSWFDLGRGIRINQASGSSVGTYTSRAFPFEAEGSPTAWKTISVSQQTTTGLDQITYDVLDATTGAVVAGFNDVQPVGGAINISTISTASHPRLKVRASLSGSQTNACFQEITDASDPNATCSPEPLGINNSDVVFGNLWRGGSGCKERGFRWTTSGGMQVLQSLGGDARSLISYAYAQNDSGFIVGESMTASKVTHAVVWAPNSPVPTDVTSSLPAGVSAWATSISNGGKIGGMLGGSAVGPFRSLSGALQTVAAEDLPANATWDWRALINENGDVAGRYKPADAAYWHAFVWQADGTFVDVPAPGDVAHLTGFNDSGWLVGYGDIARDAWLYRPGEPILAFSSLVPSGRFLVANALNNSGKVVGSYVDAQDHRRPFSWTSGGGVSSIDASTWANAEAIGVNGNGAVLVVGYDNTKPLPPFANIGFNQGGATVFKPMPGPLPEVWGNRLAHEGYNTFNNNLNTTGFYTTTDVVGGEPAEVPFFSGDCGNGTPSLASIAVNFESPKGEVVSFDTEFAGDSCADSQAGQVNLSADVDSNLSNNVAVAPLWLSRADIGVDIARWEDAGGLVGTWTYGLDWSVKVTNHSQATVAGAKVTVDVTPTFSLYDQNGNLVGPKRTITIGSIAPGQTVTKYVEARDIDWLVPNGTSITATATVSADNDCITDNNTDASTTVYGDAPNLFVSSAADPVVNTGDSLTYTVKFGNNGTQPFTGRATLKAQVGGLAILEGEVANDWNSGFVFAAGLPYAEYLVDGTQTPLWPGETRIMTLTVAAPNCVAATSGSVTSSAAWTVTDGNATDNTTAFRSLVAGEPTDDPSLCAPVCETDADCPVQDSVCAGTAVCLGSLGCAYNDLALNADVDSTYCSVNERCVNGALVTDVRTCQAYCSAVATGAVCDLDKDACVDVYEPDVKDRDFDGMPDVCDECAVDFYECDGANNAMYSLVQDASGEPVGSVRCVRNRETDEVVCDTKPGTNELVIYPDLVCGGTDAAMKAKNP